MIELIELNIDTADGIADCRLELHLTDDGHFYAATILYPHIVNGYSRSEIYCYNLVKGTQGYYMEETEDGIHPKIKKLEELISAGIVAQNK